MHALDKPRVVVVGAGFGGLTLARALRKAPVEVLLIDRENYHTFQPLLYQVATAGLEPEEIAHAVRGIFHRQKNFDFRLGDVVGVDWNGQAVLLADGGRIRYDYLVWAAGLATSFFGIAGAEEHGFPLKSLTEAVALRSHIIRQFERASEDPSLIDQGVLTLVVVGGGPTGVEMAGALVELFQKVLRKDYPRLAVERARVVLVEASSRLLGSFHKTSQAYALRKLTQRGVEIRLDEPVVRVEADAVTLQSGAVLPMQTLVWAAGVRTPPLADALALEQTGGGRLVVETDLSVPGRPNVFVIGDMAASRDEAGQLHPQLAPVAMQGARHVARQIRHRMAGRAATPFRYRDKGIMATIGRNAAVTELAFDLRTTGFVAWVMWLFLHLVLLIGFRNRLNVLINWAWNYFTYDRSARLIMAPPHGTEGVEGAEAETEEAAAEPLFEQAH